MLEKLEKCHARLQKLTIQPTKTNMENLLQTLYDLAEIYEELKAKENESKDGDADV